jgi:arabinose-5-phosphate isomerase
MALGDALAIALLERRGFSEDDFGKLHPGGALGRRLLRVDEIMHVGDDLPLVGADVPAREAVREISLKRLGVTGVTDPGGLLVGIITDGDLRRAIESVSDLRSLRAQDIMSRDPKTVAAGALAEQALALMEQYKITSLMILDASGRPVGIVHLHDLLRAGVV